jgi:hypothetical protein
MDSSADNADSQPSPADPPDRQLAGLEKAARITDEVGPFNVVSVLRLAGNLPASTLRQALDELQRRHPLLRARISNDKKGYAFHFDAAGPILLETGERPAGDGWIAAAQEELHRPLSLTTGPLARCRHLVDQSGCEVILTIHHSIVDATCGSHLFRELLALCAGQAPTGVGDQAQEGRLPATALYPDEYRGLGFARSAAAFMARQMADEMSFRWRSRGVRKPPIAATGRCCLLPIRFPAPLTAALIQTSRRRRITLTAILSAGLMTAVQRCLYQSPRVPLRHIVFADLRSRLRTVLPDTMLGCLVTPLRVTVLVEAEGALLDLARDIQAATLRAARSGERYLAYSMSPAMMRMLFRLRAFRMAATALSYSGPLDLPTNWGSFEVTGVHAFAANFTLGPEYSGLVRLYRGELWWDLLYLDSDMDEAGARQIAHEIQTVLEAATC